MDYIQDMVAIDEKEGLYLPRIRFEGKEYYPINFILTHILLRTNKFKDKTIPHETLVIDYGEGGLQPTKCLSIDEIEKFLGKMKRGSIKGAQIERFNKLINILNLRISEFNNRFIYEFDFESSNYNEYIIDAIRDVDFEKWQLCSKCNQYYPYHENFFAIDRNKSNGEFYTYCRDCTKGSGYYILRNDKRLSQLYNAEGIKSYKDMRDGLTYLLYKDIRSKDKTPPLSMRNRESYLNIINGLRDELITRGEINHRYLVSEYKLVNVQKMFSNHELNMIIYGNDYFYYPWRFKKFFYNKTSTLERTDSILVEVFKRYLEEHSIVMDDIFTFDYVSLLKQCKIYNYVNSCLLQFIVKIHNGEYAGYLFSIRGDSYYSKEENVLMDLKYLIDKDLKIPTNKIPIYLTKYTLNLKARPLYHHIVAKKNESILYWVNKLYPDKFIELDFTVNPTRNKFDSDKELYIDEILRENFSNVHYNQRIDGKELSVGGKVPDWFIFTNHGVYIVEYYGMMTKNTYNSSRVEAYKKKHDSKMDVYENEVSGYKFLFIYPDDLKSNYKGLKEKIKYIINE